MCVLSLYIYIYKKTHQLCQYLHHWTVLKFVTIITFFTVQGKYCCPCACHGCMRGSGCRHPCIFNLCLRWKWVVSSTPSLLYLKGKSPPYPVTRRLGVPQSPSEPSEEINLLPLLGIEQWFLRCSVGCLVNMLSAIMALLYTVLYILRKSCHTLKNDNATFLFCMIMCEFFMFCTQIR